MGETGILGTGPDICPTSGTDSLRARPGSPGGLLRPTPPHAWHADKGQNF